MQLHKIKEKFTKKRIKEILPIFIYIIIIGIILLCVAKIMKKDTKFYDANLPYRWDMIISYDDMHYARNIYADTDKDYATSIKHPLLVTLAHGFVHIEEKLFPPKDSTDHYYHIVLLQIILNLLSVIYLYKILKEHIGLKNEWSFLLLTIYELATVSILGTFFVESFIISSTLLIMSYYYLAKQKLIPSIILGILTTGITITNAIPFALMSICLLKKKKDIFITGISCILGSILILLMIPERDYILTNFFSVLNDNKKYIAKSNETIKYAFNYLLISPFLFIKQSYVFNKKDLLCVRFTTDTNIFVAIFIIIIFSLMAYCIIKNIKNRNMLAATFVLIFNFILHIVFKFGLTEATIYALHFLFAEIIILAFSFKIESKNKKVIAITLIILVLILQIVYNTTGFIEILTTFNNQL